MILNQIISDSNAALGALAKISLSEKLTETFQLSKWLTSQLPASLFPLDMYQH